MTLAMLRLRHPVVARTWEMARKHTKTQRALARSLGVDETTVSLRLKKARELLGLPATKVDQYDYSAIDAQIADDGRCRCGLRLPCNRCLPKSAAELAALRPGCGLTYPEGGP